MIGTEDVSLVTGPRRMNTLQDFFQEVRSLRRVLFDRARCFANSPVKRRGTKRLIAPFNRFVVPLIFVFRSVYAICPMSQVLITGSFIFD